MTIRLVKNWNPITISVPDELLEKLDYLRHDVPRSKYIQRIIEEHLRFIKLS